MAGPGHDEATANSTVRMVVSDVDGTLVRNDKSITPPTIEAVQRLRDAGIAFSIISARPARGLLGLIETLSIDQPTAAFNGGTVTGADGEVLSAIRLSHAAVTTTLALFQQSDVEVWVFADDQWFVVDANGPLVPKERHTIGYDPVVLERFDDHLERVDKIVAASHAHDMLARLEIQASQALDGQARAVRSQPYYLDVTDIQADKGAGVADLASAVGIPLTDVAVIGDGRNDLAMFRRAGLAIAMGQAAPEVQAAAAHVTLSNEQDGVAWAIDRFILGRN